MRTISPALQAHLDSGTTTLATCWRLTRRDGTAFGFTDHDRSLVFDGTNFAAMTGGTLSALEASAGLSVDNAEIEGAFNAAALTPADLDAGRYDGATLEVWRVNWQDTEQRLLLKTGTLGEVRRGSHSYTAELRGLSARLDEETGRVYQHGCDAVLGDTRCGVDLAAPAYKSSATVSAIPGQAEISVTGLDAFANGWFTHGLVTFTGGQNAGLRVPVRRHVAGTPHRLILWQPPHRPVAAGDTLILTAGCDRRFATCRNKFANGLNFRGMPHIPGNDFVTRYPVSGEPNTGGKRS
ncbi:DUF2163 domain-containing protein [Aquisalinus flavus]|uniref:Bacteriophage phiJL001 Gp84 C-terminal domain-containing protein n=1 Tax=Aquisalinus flavus TaxID=1526572 RepID=A0A8J2Y6F1_9PROT|nr:DUF2163 domain-containing protein [Aquisalinus flavus]MBD0426294.1 DUF2163 domain-containing protein [Aquisalinus flavus]UNE48138.1 DUF2163 domain-containing protein [Aquisalinus flavus]GGD09105.1 hypothetical protein GCM10011342_17430 [Aquisalinus flavus]